MVEAFAVKVKQTYLALVQESPMRINLREAAVKTSLGLQGILTGTMATGRNLQAPA